jgi:hypothetical protein
MAQDKEFEAFRAMMLSQFARLAENAGRYVGRMSNIHKELTLHAALVCAWHSRTLFNPQTEQLAKFWDEMLRAVISDTPCVELRCLAGWETVPSEVFLTWILAVGVPTDE